MHSYLRAVGFSKFTKKADMDKVLQMIIKEPDYKMMAEQEEQNVFVQLDKKFGEQFGITICGEYNELDQFSFDYYYPFFYGDDITTKEKPGIERHAAKESYSGLCDDFRIGISIIFYINNVANYKQSLNSTMFQQYMDGVVLSGLSNRGRVLLPINKTESQREADKQAIQQRNQLISAAKQGDEKAMESLTLEDLDIFSMVGRRISKEDILSIVETYFMPRGIECDQYTVLGEILDYHLETNSLTQEKVYIITICCNDVIFNICINEIDLIGEPDIGRRLKADIWLQGTLHFAN